METVEEAELCFPEFINTSCKKSVQHDAENIFFYILVSCISVITVFLNLLVIISISHFRQLHSPTNLLLLSLAVSHFLVGLLLMPLRILLIGGCWFLGNFMCGLFQYAFFIITSSSVGNMVLISVDRYVAIHDPLSYPTKVTQSRVKVCVCLCWACSVSYNGVILIEFLKHTDTFNSCYGECVAVINYKTRTVDFILTLFVPITVIVVLYMRIFVVAVTQARAMRSHITAVQGSVGPIAKKSERKAAVSLGVVVVVFLICFSPYFYLSFVETSDTLALSVFGVWLPYCNSCLHPLIYSYFFPWFRKVMKLSVTLKILQSNPCDPIIL